MFRLFLVLSLVFSCTKKQAPSEVMSLSYIGSKSCKSCHQMEYSKWERSHHFRSMNEATSQFVVGDFNSRTLKRGGLVHKLYKKADTYYALTDGPSGKLEEFEIKYTFGFKPIQQYLVQLPKGKLQVLALTWDIEKKEWFYMTDEIHKNQSVDHTDWLHWSRQSQNWNGMCADCHVTDFKKNYDIKTDSFDSKFTEMNVSCEACHGPASGHEKWLVNKDADIKFKGFEKSYSEMPPHKIVNQCARCHSRRSALSDNKPKAPSLFDHMVPAIPMPTAYYIDGQVNEEDFVYSSFLQSKMYKNHISCIACHDSHTNELRVEGTGVCTQCHSKENYASKKHHKHISKEATNCLNCHMTGKLFMSRDFRRDHSFRIPRPDLSQKFETPNACSSCHSEKNIEWVMKNYKRMYKKPKEHFSEVLVAANAKDISSIDKLKLLIKDSNKIIGALAIDSISRNFPQQAVAMSSELLMNDNDMLRHQSVTSLPLTDQNISGFVRLLKDPLLAIRTRSAFKLSAYEKYIPNEAMSDYELARKEYINSQNYNYDFPQTKMNLAILEYNQGDYKEAEHYLLAVQKQDKLFLDAYVYLAYIYNQMGEREKAVKQFKTYLKFNPYDSQRLYELALLFAEMKLYKEAIGNLEKALSYEPNNPSFMLNLAKLYEIDRHLNKAENIFIKIIDQNSKEQAYYAEFINFYRRTNQQKKAQTLTTEMYRRFRVTR